MKNIDIGMAVEVKGYSGIAFGIVNYHTEEKIIEEEIYDIDGNVFYIEDIDYIVDYEKVDCYMIGDDRLFTFDIDDVNQIDESAYCHSCGQIGCEHG